VTLRYRVRVVVIGIGERVDERLVAAGEDYGLLLETLFPASQVADPAFGNRNAKVSMECNDGAVPCQMTIANWYQPITAGVTPSLGVYDAACRP
jgi:hypothetical protein